MNTTTYRYNAEVKHPCGKSTFEEGTVTAYDDMNILSVVYIALYGQYGVHVDVELKSIVKH